MKETWQDLFSLGLWTIAVITATQFVAYEWGYRDGHKDGQTDAIEGRVQWEWVQYEGWVRTEPPEENR